MHVVYNTPHGILIILSFIFAVLGVIPWPPTARVPWFGLSWVFFVASFIFAS
jgi:hypothetical protein